MKVSYRAALGLSGSVISPDSLPNCNAYFDSICEPPTGTTTYATTAYPGMTNSSPVPSQVSPGAIAGVAVGAVVVAGILATIAWKLYHKFSHKSSVRSIEDPVYLAAPPPPPPPNQNDP